MKTDNLDRISEKTFCVELTNFEAVILYDLLKCKYSEFSLEKENSFEHKSLDKAYNRIFDKLENAIAKTQ